MKPVVLGGGIGGLSAAYYLTKLGRCKPSDITLIESAPRLGGWIQTVSQNGARFETGPRSIRPVGQAGANTLSLAHELGLSNRIVKIERTHPAARNRLVYAHGRLHRLPSSIWTLFRTVEPFNRPLIAALIRDVMAEKKFGEDDTVDSFVRRRFGEDVADYAFDPLIRGICAGDSRAVSVRLLMPGLYQAEQRYRSAVIGSIIQSMKEPQAKVDTPKWSAWSFDTGLETLPVALVASLRSAGVKIKTSTPCTSISITPDGATVHTTSGEVHATHVLSCIPTHSLQALLPSHPALSTCLSTIPYVTVAIANLEYPPNSIVEPAFGLLMPSSESRPILGIVYDTCVFPQDNRTIVTVMMGGAWLESHFGEEPSVAELTRVAVEQVKEIVGIRADPVGLRVQILKDCIPQYTLGHYSRVAAAHNYVQDHRLPLMLAGAAFNGISVNDVILASRNAAKNI